MRIDGKPLLREEATDKPRTVAGRVDTDTYHRLRWLAYRRDTTVGAIVGSYIENALRVEDFTGYQPPG